MKIWILFLCAVALGVKAQSDEAAVGDYWNDDYDDQWYLADLEKLGIVSAEDKEAAEDKESAAEDDNNFNDYDNVGNQEKSQDDIDKKVEEEIQQFQENEDEIEDENEGVDSDVINDYQFEDNRSESKEMVGEDDKDVDNNESESAASAVDYEDYGIKLNEKGELDIEALEKEMFNAQQANDEEVYVSKDDDIVPLPMLPQSNDEVEQILDDTKTILGEEEQKPNDFENDKAENESENNIEDIIEETKKILEETSNQFDEENNKDSQVNDGVVEKPEEEAVKDGPQIDKNISDPDDQEDEDTVDKVYEDLNDDLDTLFETLNKLKNSVNEDDASVNADYAVDSKEGLDNKEDYENIFDSNLSDLFAEHSNIEDAISENKQPFNEPLETNSIETVKEQGEAKEIADEAKEIADEVKEIADEAKEISDDTDDIAYSNDALVSDDDNAPVSNDVKPSIKTVSVDELSDDQLEKLMEDFAVQHSDAFNIEASDDQHVVNEILLKYGEVEVITSDNYPAGYPTNRIVDWIITGEGVGIEFKVNDFAVNSALGDYLLVKPGQADDSGSDGLIFSYHLNSPRAYRFMDVDRLFLRFDSKNGFSFLRGFNLTVQMIAPLPEEPEPEPEPEPVLPEPISTFTVHLGGLTLQEFKEIEESFRILVADMATMYINANDIDLGMNTTAEITQITAAHLCNIQWPGYQLCAAVRLAVPLQYEDEGEQRLNVEDLATMWETYGNQDPFASRLRQMGIEEFSVPNDRGVLTVWLVVALGVLVSAAMLAFALWRYTCFKDYSRMPAFSDTDSISRKHLDLYPTPHQTLPPLYAENEYKWDKFEDSTRVDMGGFANRSYVRTDMYDLDSDEEVVVPRDSKAGFQPRDYSV